MAVDFVDWSNADAASAPLIAQLRGTTAMTDLEKDIKSNADSLRTMGLDCAPEGMESKIGKRKTKYLWWYVFAGDKKTSKTVIITKIELKP